MRPPTAHPASAYQLRVLLALDYVHRRDGRATLRTVAEQAELAHSTTHHHLCALRRMGLIEWPTTDTGSRLVGTMRPALTTVAAG